MRSGNRQGLFMEWRLFSRGLILLLAAVLVTIGLGCGTCTAFTGSKEVQPGSYTFLSFDMSPGDVMGADIHSRSHGLDIFVMDQENFDNFVNGMKTTPLYGQMAVVDMDGLSYKAADRGQYYLVIANNNVDPVIVSMDTKITHKSGAKGSKSRRSS